MSTTTTITVMQEDKRGDSSRKQLRLPAIAPKDDQASSTSSGRSGRINTPAIPPRARLPPRSRTGCWTCRTRKVKCDEGRPVCGQCARLGHTCDYSPRLSFRDDTTRVVERMQDVTVAGSTIWDRPSLINPNRRHVDRSVGVASPSTSSADSTVDDLPPFASLLTDEDRERKAEASSPGTYNVVVNPESFQHLPEYSDDADIKREALSPIRRASIATSLTGSLGRDSVMEGIPIPGDPNIVVLPRFEDLSRRPTRELRPPISPVVTSKPQIKREDSDMRLPPSTPENHILQHFRDAVWKYFVPPEHGPDSSMTLLDETASQFPALMQAIMAVACLALGQHDANDRLDALQHHSQVLPELQKSLKSEEDLASDGAFLTHFLMLIYEIAAADIEHPNIWPHHIQTLLKITLLRRRIFGAERFPFIVWWVCNIDLDAVLSGMGQGDFVRHMWKNDLIPPPSFHLYPLGSDGSSVVYTEEKNTLPTVLQLDYESTLLTIQLALLAHEFRQDANFETNDMRQKAMNIKLRQTRIFDIQENLRRLWMVSPVGELSQARLPVRSQRLYQRAVLLYRACIIYSHTSMWPAQRLETSPNFDDEIATSVNEILHIAHNTIDNNHYSSKFMVFPLFMAGFASTDGNQKMLALDLIQKMEEEGLWRNTLATRRALEAVYERQNERFLNSGHSLDVDWLGIMIEQGLTVVNFGL